MHDISTHHESACAGFRAQQVISMTHMMHFGGYCRQQIIKYTKEKMLTTSMGGTMGKKMGYKYKHTYCDIGAHSFKFEETLGCI